MIEFVKKFEKNTKGNDYVVGDIHGMYPLLEKILVSIDFDPKKDRLFSVGDLVDRGGSSHHVIHWLKQDWFFPVFGNHEEIFLLYSMKEIDISDFMRVGGKWAIHLKEDEIKEIANLFRKLPLAIEVETDKGNIGIIHADCPTDNWNELNSVLNSHKHNDYYNHCIWSHRRQTSHKAVEGIEALIVGHMTQSSYQIKGNVHMIDTGAVYNQGYFTILDLNTLLPIACEF